MVGKYTLMKKPDFSKHGPHVTAMMTTEGWTDDDISDERKPVVNPSKILHTVSKQMEELFRFENVSGDYELDSIDVDRLAVVFVMRGNERTCHDRADDLVEWRYGDNISVKRKVDGHDDEATKHVYTVRSPLAKMVEVLENDEAPIQLEVTDDLLD